LDVGAGFIRKMFPLLLPARPIVGENIPIEFNLSLLVVMEVAKVHEIPLLDVS